MVRKVIPYSCLMLFNYIYTRTSLRSLFKNTLSQYVRLCSVLKKKAIIARDCRKFRNNEVALIFLRRLSLSSGSALLPRCIQRLDLLQQEKRRFHRVPEHQRL